MEASHCSGDSGVCRSGKKKGNRIEFALLTIYFLCQGLRSDCVNK